MALGERLEPGRELAHPQAAAGAQRRHQVGGARGVRRAQPFAVARPAADAGAADAGLFRDLGISQIGVLDQMPDICDCDVGVRPARATRTRFRDRGRALGGIVRLDAEADEAELRTDVGVGMQGL